MMLRQTAILLVFLFVLMASASAQPRDVQMNEELKAPRITAVFLSDIQPNGRTQFNPVTTSVEDVPNIGSVVNGDSKQEIKVLDKYELMKDDYFTRKPIILLQNSRARTDD